MLKELQSSTSILLKGSDCSIPECSPGCSKDYGYCEVKTFKTQTILKQTLLLLFTINQKQVGKRYSLSLKILYFCILKWPGDCFCIQGVGYQGPNCTDCKPLSGYIIFVHKCTYQTTYTPRPRHANNFTFLKIATLPCFQITARNGFTSLIIYVSCLFV